MPRTAPDRRRDRAKAAAASWPEVTAASACRAKTTGIILYVEPLPMPLTTNRAVNPVTNRGKDPLRVASSSTPM